MDFDLQDFLRDMRAEQKEDHRSLDAKVDTALQRLVAHDERIKVMSAGQAKLRSEVDAIEPRLMVVETSRKNVRWFVSVVVGGAIAFLFELAHRLVGK